MRVILLTILFLPLVASGRDLHWAVCIDPGHGPSSAGVRCSTCTNVEEYDLTAQIGDKVYWILRPEIESDVPSLPPDRGYVSLTRFAWQTPTPDQRAEIGQGKRADAYNRVVKPDSTWADIFISIHFDTRGSRGSLVLVKGSPNWGCPNSVGYDSSCAFGVLLMSRHIASTSGVWDDAGAKTCGCGFKRLPPEGAYTDPRCGGVWLRNERVKVLTHPGWDNAPIYHARCILECEALRDDFCCFMENQDNLNAYVSAVVEGIVTAVREYRQRADPGGAVRIVGSGRSL